MYDTEIKGKRLIFYENCLELDGVTIYYRDMEHITQAFEEQPVFRFGYKGRDIRIPCREDEYQTFLEYFIKAADQSPTTDTVSFLDSAKKKNEYDPKLDDFTENKYSSSGSTYRQSSSGSGYRQSGYDYGTSRQSTGSGHKYYGGGTTNGSGYEEVYREGAPEGPRCINKHIFVWVCSFIFGVLGVDRFARGQIGLGLIKLFTGGLGGFWYIADFIIAALKAYGTYRDSEDLYFDVFGHYTR